MLFLCAPGSEREADLELALKFRYHDGCDHSPAQAGEQGPPPRRKVVLTPCTGRNLSSGDSALGF